MICEISVTKLSDRSSFADEHHIRSNSCITHIQREEHLSNFVLSTCSCEDMAHPQVSVDLTDFNERKLDIGLFAIWYLYCILCVHYKCVALVQYRFFLEIGLINNRNYDLLADFTLWEQFGWKYLLPNIIYIIGTKV